MDLEQYKKERDGDGLWFPFVPCFEARLEGVEVARVRLEETIDLSTYPTAPPLGHAALEIGFFEVAPGRRDEGIGSAFVGRLAAMYPNRRLLALSRDADRFWGKTLGWDRHEHGDEPDWYQPLYIQPAERFTDPWLGRRGWR